MFSKLQDIVENIDSNDEETSVRAELDFKKYTREAEAQPVKWQVTILDRYENTSIVCADIAISHKGTYFENTFFKTKEDAIWYEEHQRNESNRRIHGCGYYSSITKVEGKVREVKLGDQVDDEE